MTSGHTRLSKRMVEEGSYKCNANELEVDRKCGTDGRSCICISCCIEPPNVFAPPFWILARDMKLCMDLRIHVCRSKTTSRSPPSQQSLYKLKSDAEAGVEGLFVYLAC